MLCLEVDRTAKKASAPKNTDKPTNKGAMTLDFGTANAKQALFFASRTLYTGYGGARGGGKSWAVRAKAVGGAITYPGIRILIIRRTYPELQQNHIEPIIKMVPSAIGSYNGSLRTMYFTNGSYIKFGHGQSTTAIETEYQGKRLPLRAAMLVAQSRKKAGRLKRESAMLIRGEGR